MLVGHSGRLRQDDPMTLETTAPVPPHVEEAVAIIAALHAAHHREARGLQKAVSRATSGIAARHVNLDHCRDRRLGDAQYLLADVRTRGARPISLPPAWGDGFDDRPLPCGDDPHDPAPRR